MAYRSPDCPPSASLHLLFRSSVSHISLKSRLSLAAQSTSLGCLLLQPRPVHDRLRNAGPAVHSLHPRADRHLGQLVARGEHRLVTVAHPPVELGLVLRHVLVLVAVYLDHELDAALPVIARVRLDGEPRQVLLRLTRKELPRDGDETFLLLVDGQGPVPGGLRRRRNPGLLWDSSRVSLRRRRGCGGRWRRGGLRRFDRVFRASPEQPASNVAEAANAMNARTSAPRRALISSLSILRLSRPA